MDKLHKFFGKLASSLPTTSDSEPFIVTENSLPCPQQLISTGRLVVKKGVHQYGSWYHIDQLLFFAHKETRANASKLLLIETKVKNQRKNKDFAFDYFLSPKAIT